MATRRPTCDVPVHLEQSSHVSWSPRYLYALERQVPYVFHVELPASTETTSFGVDTNTNAWNCEPLVSSVIKLAFRGQICMVHVEVLSNEEIGKGEEKAR